MQQSPTCQSDGKLLLHVQAMVWQVSASAGRQLRSMTNAHMSEHIRAAFPSRAAYILIVPWFAVHEGFCCHGQSIGISPLMPNLSESKAIDSFCCSLGLDLWACFVPLLCCLGIRQLLLCQLSNPSFRPSSHGRLQSLPAWSTSSYAAFAHASPCLPN